MSKKANPPRPQPGVDLKGLQERKLLEAELYCHDGQLRDFAPVRDRLVAGGQDATAAYRQLLLRRDAVAAKLRRPPTPVPEGPRPPQPRLDQPLSALPIAPALYNPVTGVFGMGFSGAVQTGPLAEGVSVVPGVKDTSGRIVTTGLGEGSVTFDGWPSAGPDQIPADQFDPSVRYFWLHNWHALVPFPAPAAASDFTYRFEVDVRVSLFFRGGFGRFLSFVSVGETANLVPGHDVQVNIDAGWPLIADLTQNTPTYNGSYGPLQGQATVQRSFAVGAGHVPAVAVVVGAAVGLSMQADVRLSFADLPDSGIALRDPQSSVLGRVTFFVRPQPVLEP
jgi:hypothetical protein